MITAGKKTLLAAAAALAVAGTGTSLAYAQTPTPTTPTAELLPSQTAPGAAAKPGAHHRGWFARVEHGEFTVHTKTGEQVSDVQHGTVSALDGVNGQSITVRSTDGVTATYTIDPQTKVRKDKATASISQVAVNDRVAVVATKTGSTATAKRIGDAGPPSNGQVGRPRALRPDRLCGSSGATVQDGQVAQARVLVVEDPGIATADRERIFDRLVRLDTARTRPDDQTGAGLGLAIARGFARAHGGDLRCVAPAAGVTGAMFCLELPG
ncbi:MAG: hypothetical protein H0V41_03250 [Pseudonocardiales bacterium]|nr:hypothetical protein [Pseudonocardiales bacterium]